MLDTFAFLPQPSRLLRPALRFSVFTSAIVHVRPTLHHSLAMLVRNQSERQVMKLDQRSALHLTQPVLHVGADRIGHEQRPIELQQRGPLDRLHMAPQMAVLTAQVAIPTPAWPWFKLQRHGL